MKLTSTFLVLAVCLWGAVSCKPTPPNVSPTAADSVRVVTTFASANALSVKNSPASITGLAFDPSGNLYATDYAHRLIRKITPAGLVSTFAGTGEEGYSNGPAASAQFGNLVSMACDKAGNLYVGEAYGNACIRKITPDGIVSAFAGKPYSVLRLPFIPSTSADGPDTSARFITPITMGFDSFDNLFVSDVGSVNYYASDAIRKITPDGYVRTIAGYVSGLAYQGRVLADTPPPVRFTNLAVNQANNVVAVDRLNRLVYQITPTGEMSLFLNTRFFTTPQALLFDPVGNLLVAEQTKIWQVNPSKQVITLTGSDQRGFLNDSLKTARFTSISALAFDKQGTLYIADQGSIRRVRFK